MARGNIMFSFERSRTTRAVGRKAANTVPWWKRNERQDAKKPRKTESGNLTADEQRWKSGITTTAQARRRRSYVFFASAFAPSRLFFSSGLGLSASWRS